jgi:hypothetical protein
MQDHLNEGVGSSADDAVIEGILAGMAIEGEGEVLEEAETQGAVAVEARAEPIEPAAHGEDEALVESAANAADRQDLYAAQGEGAEFLESAGSDTPQTPPEAVTDPEAAKRAKAEAKKAEKEAKKAEREKKRAETKAKKDAERAAKPPRATSVTHQPGDLLVAKLGGDWREYVVFSNEGAADTLATEAAQNAFIERMNDRDAIADKVREKAIMLFGWLKAGGELNKVMDITFRVLHRDGELTSGEKGNLTKALLAKPYSKGTANSQANQMFMLLPELGIALKEKGKLTPNPDSALLPMVYSQLGLVKADDASADVEVEAGAEVEDASA